MKQGPRKHLLDKTGSSLGAKLLGRHRARLRDRMLRRKGVPKYDLDDHMLPGRWIDGLITIAIVLGVIGFVLFDFSQIPR